MSQSPASFEFAEVSTPNIARQLSRLERIKFAVAAQRIAFDEDGQAAWELAVPASDDEHWQKYWRGPKARRASYEVLKIHSLKYGLKLSSLHQFVSESCPEPIDISTPSTAEFSHSELLQRSNTVEKQARFSALGRIGLLDVSAGQTKVPTDVAAAFHFEDPNIRLAEDRLLYERADEIDEALEKINSAVPVRLGAVAVTGFKNGAWQRETVPALLYEKAEDAATWWDELTRDLGLIDQASENL